MKIDNNELVSILINPKLNQAGQYICDCPFCGKEKHFYVSKKTQLWDCKKCGQAGNVFKLLKHFGKTYLLKGQTVENKDSLISIKNKLIETVEEDEAVKDLPIKKMPAGWRIFSKESESKYLMSRGITIEDCLRYKIGYTNLISGFKNYVIIPVYDDNLIKGFVGRYADKKVPVDKLRYNNSKNTKFSELLFGYDEITDKTMTVILVEGIFDKIAVDKFLRLWEDDEIKCVCTFGKEVSKIQQKKLKIKKVKRVILLYDFDAIKQIKKYGVELEENFLTSITFTTKKDIDECNLDEALSVFNNLRKPEDFNVNIVGKLKKK